MPIFQIIHSPMLQNWQHVKVTSVIERGQDANHLRSLTALYPPTTIVHIMVKINTYSFTAQGLNLLSKFPSITGHVTHGLLNLATGCFTFCGSRVYISQHFCEKRVSLRLVVVWAICQWQHLGTQFYCLGDWGGHYTYVTHYAHICIEFSF